MADRTVVTRLVAEATGYVAGFDQAARKTRELASEADKLAAKRQSFEMLGRAAVGFGVATLAATGLAVRAAIQWESAWTGVMKTVDGSASTINQLETDLRDLATSLPATHQEIAAVAEAAGQLGVQAENVAAFTRVMVDLGETTNLTSDEAATSLAQLMNIMQTAPEDVDRLGAAVVDLGNNGASTERDIVQMAQRIAGAGAIIGLSEGEVLGLANALASVGIEAEAGGSSVSKIMIDIAKAVSDGGDDLRAWADLSGQTAQEFSEAWATDPSSALASVIEGMGRLNAAGGDVFATLEGLGQTDIRVTRSLLSLANSGDLLRESLTLGNQAWKDNTALAVEAAKRYATTEAQLQVLGNRVNDAAIEFGEVFLPAINAVAAALGGFASFLGDLDPTMQAVIAVTTALVGAVALAGGAALLAVPKIAQMKVAMDVMGISASRAGKMVGVASAAITGATLIIGFFIAEQAKAAANTDMFRESLDKTTGSMTQYTRELLAKKLADSGAYEAAREAGISQRELTDAVLEGGDALDDVYSKLAGNNNVGTFFTGVGIRAGNASSEIRSLRGSLEESERSFENIQAAGDGAADTLDENTVALHALSGAAGDAQGEIADLADEIRGFGSAQFDLREANRQVEQSLDDLRESIAENGRTLDITTEAGLANEEAVDRLAQSYLDQAAAVGIQQGSLEAALPVLAAGREAFIAEMESILGSRDAAEALADQLGLLPANVQVLIDANAAPAEAVVDRFANKLQTLYRDFDGRTIRFYADGSINFGGNPNDRAVANGGLFDYGVQAFAAGGFASGIYAGRPGSIHKFAEPETGWEAYISGKPSERQRNLGIWAQTGDRLGAWQSASAGAAPQFNVVVQSKGGVDLLQYVDVRVEAADRSRQMTLSAGKQVR